MRCQVCGKEISGFERIGYGDRCEFCYEEWNLMEGDEI